MFAWNSFALVFALLALVAYAGATEDPSTPDEDVEDTASNTLPLVVSRHMLGRWESTRTHACSARVTKGSLFFGNETNQYFAWRDDGGNKIDVPIMGEGTSSQFLPFLQNIDKKRGMGEVVFGNYGYQICTSRSNIIETPSDHSRNWGPLTETRVMRGFIFDVPADGSEPLVLDRCVEGINRNYNVIVTTVGAPIPSDMTGPGPMTRHIRLVRWQIRLPGNMKCEPDAFNSVDDAALVYDRASTDAFDTFVWTRSEPPLKSFWEENFNMLVFATLFIFFRMYTGYRYSSQKLKVQKEFLKEVSQEEAKQKETILAAAKKKA